MEADAAHIAKRSQDNLFSLWVARPKRAMPSWAVLWGWKNVKRAREEVARSKHGR